VFEVAPTDGKLKEDAIKVAQRLHALWDGEVECMVIFSRRDGPLNLQWAGTFNRRSKQVAVLRKLLEIEPVLVNDK